MVYLLVALGFMFFAAVAMTINEGLWSNTITFICLVLSGLVGAVVGVPVGVMVMEQTGKTGEFAWYFVFAGMWLVFVVTMLILRILTDKASKIRVRYLPIVDKLGGILMCLFVATMLEAFAAYTLLIAPLQSGAWKVEGLSEQAHAARMQKAAIPFKVALISFNIADDIDYPLFDPK